MLKTFIQEEGIYQSEIVFAETIKSGRIKKYKGDIKAIFLTLIALTYYCLNKSKQYNVLHVWRMYQ